MRVIIYSEAVNPESLAETLREDAIVVLGLVRPEAKRIQAETADLFDEGERPLQLEALFGKDIETTFGWLHYMVDSELYEFYMDEGIRTFIMRALERQRSQSSQQSVFETSVY